MGQDSINEKKTDGLDIKQFLFFIITRKILFGGTILISIIGGIIYFLLSKPLWEGRFQVVLTEKDNKFSNLSNLNPEFANLVNLGTENSNRKLKTELSILKSPSLLNPIYEFVKTKKNKLGVDTKDWRFDEWRDNHLEIILEKGTSVVNLSYKDNDKDIVDKVILNISKNYQEYSNRENVINLRNYISFLNEQILLTKNKSKIAFNKVDSFASKYDLPPQTNYLTSPKKLNAQINDQKNLFFDLENDRILAANEIRIIDVHINQIKELIKKNEGKIYSGYFPELKDQNSNIVILNEMDKDIAKAKAIYKPNDPTLKKLVKTRINFANSINKKTLDILESKKTNSVARVKAAERPEGILIEYRSLIREARRENESLNSLENELQNILIIEAKKELPWELITQPAVFDKPVAPRKKYIFGASLLIGTLTGTSICILLGYRSDLLWSEELIDSNINLQLIDNINSKNLINSKLKDILAQKHSKNINKKVNIALFIIGEIDKELFKNLKSYFSNSKNIEFNLNEKLDDYDFDYNYFLIKKGQVKKAELFSINNQIKFLNLDSEGFIIIS